MGIITIVIIGIGLSMDAFAVSMCCGVCLKEHKLPTALKAGITFGLFQAIMPLIGFALGYYLKDWISEVDHWVAFGLLAMIGGKMFYEAFKTDDCKRTFNLNNFYLLLTLGFATSIDALAVGLSFALLEINILVAVLIIGLLTFIISFAGVYLGKRFSCVLGNKAEIAGGIILIGIGLKILLEHLLA